MVRRNKRILRFTLNKQNKIKLNSAFYLHQLFICFSVVVIIILDVFLESYCFDQNFVILCVIIVWHFFKMLLDFHNIINIIDSDENATVIKTLKIT